MIKPKSVPDDIAILQLYMPTTQASDDEVEKIKEQTK